ncbi:hypothetical protein D3C71_595440 [compost metagenome]
MLAPRGPHGDQAAFHVDDDGRGSALVGQFQQRHAVRVERLGRGRVAVALLLAWRILAAGLHRRLAAILIAGLILLLARLALLPLLSLLSLLPLLSLLTGHARQLLVQLRQRVHLYVVERGLAQQVADILFQAVPEIIFRTIDDQSGRVVIAAAAVAAALRAADGVAGAVRSSARRGNLRGDIHAAVGTARHVDVIDLVIAPYGRIGQHRQVLAIDFVAHIDLLADTRQQLRQGLVQRIQGDAAFDLRVDVDIHARVARQRKQQRLHGHLVHGDAVGFHFGRRQGRGQRAALLHRFGNGAGWAGRGIDVGRRQRRLMRGAAGQHGAAGEGDPGGQHRNRVLIHEKFAL